MNSNHISNNINIVININIHMNNNANSNIGIIINIHMVIVMRININNIIRINNNINVYCVAMPNHTWLVDHGGNAQEHALPRSAAPVTIQRNELSYSCCC